jgi:hypothetical protein
VSHQVGDVLIVVPDGGLAQVGRITNAETHEDGSVTLTLVEPRLADAGLGYMALP